MDRTTSPIARRAARVADRATRPPLLVEIPTPDGEPALRKQKRRRPSRHTSDRAAITASLLGVG
ncbi:hypothetical protein [Micromonospora sp. WMMD737]|uniref:hypothetical protein n=1 Tax=Micromonospora sp. WMMD737 TaxID=3404113 RepID=UPI003B938A7D